MKENGDNARRDLLRRLPKAELHCHLDGSIRPETLIDLAHEYGVRMPSDDAEVLREYMLVDDARNLEDYLARFAITLSVLQHADALERAAYELAEDAAREGVRYIEVRYSPVLNVHGGLSLYDVIEAPARGLRRAEKEFGIVGRSIICALRNLPPATSLELARLSVEARGEGVVGFDLAGGELGNPASEHADAFRYALEHGVHCTCHAGEGDGAASVRQAIHVCGAQRIGHATRVIEDESLMEELRERRIPLEICLTSNVQTQATQSLESHPLREYFDRGLNVVLSTDNRLMSGVTLTDEYVRASEHLGFSMEELATIARAGFGSAFLEDSQRRALMEDVEKEIASVLADAATAGTR
jgi:adenosine deaminase